ncbi:peptidoglycan D,D-transpeptidase FtsI family protein [Spirilliplanes yamanashiensis]|uniref:Penicillin-binding protein A n=1 Tax=Spirilliplanes yamanashiensis TaxID=42233 RepID=A0A8J3Y6H1_9ACTN|nr:penicillin-binding protein 2 [Spirilliplanes yamanashiensis]MDP9815017.1 peptidoglycan glycosyltransferase [Spirilliplanes yamanashiensis]GIJ02673.1 penicillin-binding protein A [Spirilliplanes yamanashiensis]
MNAPLRRAGIVIMVLFGLLFANLNWVQAYKADEYRTSGFNSRVQVAEYDRQRGVIEAGGEALAESVATNDQLKYRRTYPLKQPYAHVIGYKPVNLGATGIERSENDFLSGESDKLFADRVKDMFTDDDTGGGNVLLTLNRRAQEVAYEQLTKNNGGVDRGAAIAIDPRTGAVQALVSMPSFDPNPLADHATKKAQAAYDELLKAENGPLKNRALSEVLPPGSTFKIVMAAAALENGITKETSIPAGSTYTAPTSGAPIRNAAPSICPESQVTLAEAVRESCNTGFARLGVELGADKLKATAAKFGFGQDAELTVGNLTGGGLPVAASETGAIQGPDGQDDPGALAQSSIGQREVRMTPLQGAMIAAAVANDGKQMQPYLVQRLLGPDRRQIDSASPKVLREPITPQVASDLRDMMKLVVENGTGRNAAINGFQVGGKTGTAQTGVTKNIGWFIGFAIDDKGQPVSAVCVVLEDYGDGGSAEAARIAGRIMRAAAGRGGD